MFKPMYIGTINDRARLACLGVGYSVDNQLVFINAQGASTHIEQLDAELRSKAIYVSVQPQSKYKLPRVSGYVNRSEHSGYMVKKQAIPNSTDLSMIAVHTSVSAESVDDERPFSYLIYWEEDDLKKRIWQRVHDIVNIPIARTPEVMEFLWNRGRVEGCGWRGASMVTVATTAESLALEGKSDYWQAWGIKVASISNNRSLWEGMIAKAIKNKVIPL